MNFPVRYNASSSSVTNFPTFQLPLHLLIKILQAEETTPPFLYKNLSSYRILVFSFFLAFRFRVLVFVYRLRMYTQTPRTRSAEHRDKNSLVTEQRANGRNSHKHKWRIFSFRHTYTNTARQRSAINERRTAFRDLHITFLLCVHRIFPFYLHSIRVYFGYTVRVHACHCKNIRAPYSFSFQFGNGRGRKRGFASCCILLKKKNKRKKKFVAYMTLTRSPLYSFARLGTQGGRRC